MAPPALKMVKYLWRNAPIAWFIASWIRLCFFYICKFSSRNNKRSNLALGWTIRGRGKWILPNRNLGDGEPANSRGRLQQYAWTGNDNVGVPRRRWHLDTGIHATPFQFRENGSGGEWQSFQGMNLARAKWPRFTEWLSDTILLVDKKLEMMSRE